MAVNRKTYEKLKDELSSVRLTLETLAHPKLIEEIRKGIRQIQEGKWTRVRDDLKV